MGKIGEGAIEKSCFSIFFCGCNQLKSFHNGRKGNNTGEFSTVAL